MRDREGPLRLRWRLLAACLLLLYLAWPSSAQGQHRGQGQHARGHGQQQRPLPRLRRCEQPARFSVDGVEPMTLARGHVTLVALLTSTCSFCIRQANSLQDLHQSYVNNGTDVHMMIVSSGPAPAADEVGVFEGIVSFNVYHDDSAHTVWNQVLRGNKDDILIFNRCGKLTYHLPFPYSFLGYNYVTRAISYTASNLDVCPCPDEIQDPQDQMMGDAPLAEGVMGGHSRGHHGGSLQGESHQVNHGGRVVTSRHHGRPRGGGRSGSRPRPNGRHDRCPRGDHLCQEMKRDRPRYEAVVSAHGNVRNPNDLNEVQVLGLWERHGGGWAPPAL